jgi:hypothetical protein
MRDERPSHGRRVWQVDGRVTDEGIEGTVSVNAGGKSIILFNRKDPGNPGEPRRDVLCL